MHTFDRQNTNRVQQSMRRDNYPMQMEVPQMEVPEVEVMDKYIHPGCEDQIGDIYVVLKPNPGGSPEDIVHKTHAFGVHQFEPRTVHGVYSDEGEAAIVAEAAIRDLHKRLKKVEGKKDTILQRIGGKINALQKEINSHMKSANERPEESDTHHMLAEKKMNLIRNLRDKHKMVKAAKKQLPNQNKE